MKKMMIKLLIVCMLLSGCTPNKKIDDSAQKYEDFQFLLNAYENYKTDTTYFDISLEMSKLENGEFRYYLFVDQPIVAMYDIEIIAIDLDQDETGLMQPSIGIFDSEVYNMIPNQHNLELGFSEGLMLSGTKKFAEGVDQLLTLHVLVQWYNEDRSKQTREYLSVSYRYVGDQPHDVIEDVENAESGSDDSNENE